MDRLNDFHHYVGELLMYCQRIEHDIKWIYAGMLNGDLTYNFNIIGKHTLGQVLNKLEQLDNSDGKPYFSINEYNLLEKIKDIRNHWVHQSYVNFLYINDVKVLFCQTFFNRF